MKIFKTKFKTDQKQFLEYLKNIHAAVNTVILTVRLKGNDIYTASKKACIEGMGIINEDYRKQYELRKKAYLQDKHLFQGYKDITIFQNEELLGESIEFEEFIEGYHLETHTLKGPGKMKNKISLPKALLHTPYGLFHISNTKEYKKIESKEELEQIFQKYLEHILHVKNRNDTKELSVIRWSTNWSDYFDAGHQWWGAYCWTVYDPRYHAITFIAASTTD